MSDFKIVKLLDPVVQLNITDGITFLGAYDPLVTYQVGNSVSYNNSSYVAKATTTGNLPTNTTYWQLLAGQGPAGPQGASWQEQFETVSKNLKSYPAVLNYTMGVLTSIVFTLPGISRAV